MQNKDVWTIIDLIRWGSEYFYSKGIESPRLNIELMLCNVLKTERVKLYLNYDKPVNSIELTTLKDMVKRRAKHEPLQYVIGETEFYSMKILTRPGALIPRPETELIVNRLQSTIDELDKKTLRILDIGTGSGILAIAAAKISPESEIFAIDVSDEALNLARENAVLNDTKNINFYKMDILRQKPKSRFDIILSNPPYISIEDYNLLEVDVKDYEPMVSLCDFGDGLGFYRKFSEIFCDLLNPGGVFILEFGYGQGESIREIFEKTYELTIYKDFAKIERVVKCRLRNG